MCAIGLVYLILFIILESIAVFVLGMAMQKSLTERQNRYNHSDDADKKD